MNALILWGALALGLSVAAARLDLPGLRLTLLGTGAALAVAGTAQLLLGAAA